MLQPQELLKLDTNKLFEEHTVSEIQDVRKRLKSEIEKKKEDLRVMVGERYRDLIEAADTISDMKESASNVISHLKQMEQLCINLRAQHGESNRKERSPASQSQHHKYYSAAVQIKLLMDIPEKIWASVEKEDYLQASQLYLLAQHMYTGLNLEQDKLRWFPVVWRQWTAVDHFKEAILQGCHSHLHSPEPSPDQAVNCLASVLLLKASPLEETFRGTLLAERSGAVMEVLREEGKGARWQVCQVTMALVHSLYLVHALFVDGYPDSTLSQAMLVRLLKATTSRESPPVLTLLDSHSQDTFSRHTHLPALVLDFRPTPPPNSLTSLSPSFLRSATKDWLSSLRTQVEDETVRLLLHVESLKGLAGIREGVYSALEENLKKTSWEEVCQHVLVRRMCVWEEFFRPVVTRRAKEIIQGQLEAMENAMEMMMRKTLKDVQRESLIQPENDLQWFIWSESDSDLPRRVGWMSTVSRRIQDAGGLLMKTKGYSPRIQAICSTLDSKLRLLLEDILAYTEEFDGDAPSEHSFPFDLGTLKSSPPPFDRFTDAAEVKEHVVRCIGNSMKSLLNFIRSESSQLSQKEQAKVLLLSRFCLAICELCPHLQKGMAMDSKTVASPGEPSEWMSHKAAFREESAAMYEKWKTCVVEKGKRVLADSLDRLSLQVSLETMAEWEMVNVQEEGEEGKSIKSSISIPSHISLALSTALFMVVEEVNKVIPHTLPRKIQLSLTIELVEGLVQHYENLLKDQSASQTQALQFLFDVRYLEQLFSTRNEKELSLKIQALCEDLEGRIDPFDLDVFSPYLQQNLKKCIHRTQLVVGVLVPLDKLALLSASRPASQTAQERHNLLPVTTNVPWFPLLPLSSAASKMALGRETSEKVEEERKVTKFEPPSTKGKRDTSPVATRSGAAAFFEAVSSSWFGSGS